jgi:MFS family permease
MLLVSLVTMGTATLAIGLLRNYSSTGIWAPILLLSLRIVQGLAEVLTRAWKQVLLGGAATMSAGTSFDLIVAFGLTVSAVIHRKSFNSKLRLGMRGMRSVSVRC